MNRRDLLKSVVAAGAAALLPSITKAVEVPVAPENFLPVSPPAWQRLSTGLPRLNELTGGLGIGSLVLITGGPAVGKSKFTRMVADGIPHWLERSDRHRPTSFGFDYHLLSNFQVEISDEEYLDALNDSHWGPTSATDPESLYGYQREMVRHLLAVAERNQAVAVVELCTGQYHPVSYADYPIAQRADLIIHVAQIRPTAQNYHVPRYVAAHAVKNHWGSIGRIGVWEMTADFPYNFNIAHAIAQAPIPPR